MTGSVKQQWGKLTDDEPTEISKKLVGKLQERYGYTLEQAQRELE